MTRLRALAALSLLLIVAAACSSSGASQDLDGADYVATSVRQNGEPFRLADGTSITIRFADGSLQASAGCNSIGGTFEIEDNQLRAGDLSMTAMGCDPERHAQDDFVVNLLMGDPTVTIDGDTLRLETPDASIDFIDRAIANPNRSLEGTTWQIDGFLSGATASTFATDVNGTIEISGDVLQLFDGCATVDLPIEIEGSEIRFSPVGMPTADECEAPPGYRQSIFTALSRGALEYSIDGSNLTLATPDNVGFTLKAVE